MKKKQKLKERICALVLALAMVLTWVLPDAGMTVQAAAGDAKKVTLKFKDAAEETRGIGALTLKLQSNDDPSYEKKKEIEVKAGETSKEIELKEGVEYNYEVEKTGYETTKDGRFTVEAEKADIDILLTMSEITLLPTTDSVSLKVGETYDISVTNPVQELAYTWSTTDGNVASVENGKVTAKGEGSADISVTNGVKTKTVSVNVSKNQINGFSMTVKEPSGDDQSSVILTAKGLPADVSGNVIFYDVTGGQKTLLYKAEAAATVEYTYETDSLLGAKQFEAVYSGNEKYEGATATATGSYGKTQAITIDGDVSKEVTYGTEHWNDEIVIALADIENTLKGRTLATEVAFAQSEDAPNTGLAENVAVVRVEADHTIHVIPKNAGKVTIKIKAVPGEGNFYREASVDYTLTVKRQEVSFENVTWNKASKVYDGNTGIELTGTVNTEKITIPNYNKELEIDYSKNNQESAQKAGLTILDGRVQSLVKNETVTASLNNSNDVEIYVKVVDNAGHETEATKDLKIDITHPTIAVTYDLNTPLNERYYKDVRTATVVVTERNFDESAVRFNITNTDGTQPAISGWTHSANAGVSDDATHTCQVTFAADGDYTFTLETTDLAGNASSYNRVDDFTIDRTVPTIQVSYDNNSAATPGYFNANRTATVTVNEHNFNAAEVNAQITAALQGSGVAAPGLGGWSTNGDVHTASVTFSADADYTFDVDYTDLAGNAAADYTQDKFTVDKTDPEVEFFDIEDKSANNGTVAPGVKYSDVNYMESGVDITIKGAKHDKTELSGNRTNIANGESIKMEDFKHDEETDDVYTMTAVIKDKAGNETEKEVMFSVNRFGSNYIFSETTEKFLDDVYANKPKDLVVTEVNVDSLVFNGISYGLDGTKKELKAGSDYTVKQSGGEGSWKEYTYTIKKENFEKEGRYSVTIDSEDKATNKMNNKVKECNIDFVIDKTPPTVVITGIEESSYRADEREMTINLSDNTAVKCVDVIIDGKSVATYAQKEIEKAGGKISYMIEGASEPQKIEAAALDMAGNETTSEMHKVLVTSSVWIQYINNTPLLIGSILGIVLVAGGLIWFFVIRKKKEESK